MEEMKDQPLLLLIKINFGITVVEIRRRLRHEI